MFLYFCCYNAVDLYSANKDLQRHHAAVGPTRATAYDVDVGETKCRLVGSIIVLGMARPSRTTDLLIDFHPSTSTVCLIRINGARSKQAPKQLYAGVDSQKPRLNAKTGASRVGYRRRKIVIVIRNQKTASLSSTYPYL